MFQYLILNPVGVIGAHVCKRMSDNPIWYQAGPLCSQINSPELLNTNAGHRIQAHTDGGLCNLISDMQFVACHHLDCKLTFTSKIFTTCRNVVIHTDLGMHRGWIKGVRRLCLMMARGIKLVKLKNLLNTFTTPDHLLFWYVSYDLLTAFCGLHCLMSC